MLIYLLTAAVFVLLFVVPYYFFRWSKLARGAAGIPGPRPYPWLGNIFEFGFTTVSIMNNVIRLWKEHGPMFRVWLGPKLVVIISDPKHAEPMLSSNIHINKNFSYKFMESWLGTGLLTSSGNKWKEHRKIITPSFHFKILEDFIDVFNSNSDIFIKKLRNEVGGPEFNIYNHVTLCALDNICESAMGVSLHTQENSSSPYVRAVYDMADIIMIRTFSPWLYVDPIYFLSSLGKRQAKALDILHGTTKKVIADRKVELANKLQMNGSIKANDTNEFGQRKRQAFLDLLLQYSKQGANLSDEDIREEVDTFMFEGHDTTASGITFCIWQLALHPDIQDKVYDEMKDIFGDSDRQASYSDLQNMKYLECVIKESLRLFPSVPFYARELQTDEVFNGVKFAAGTNLLISTYTLHRHPKYFPDPEIFDPTRFEADNSQGRNPYAYVPFSAGPRNCIGQKFAMNEMKCMVSKLVRNFKVIAGGTNIVLCAELILRSRDGIFVKLENRS